MPGQTARDRMTEGLLPPQPSRAIVRRELAYFLRRLGLVALFLTAVSLVLFCVVPAGKRTLCPDHANAILATQCRLAKGI